MEAGDSQQRHKEGSEPGGWHQERGQLLERGLVWKFSGSCTLDLQSARHSMAL